MSHEHDFSKGKRGAIAPFTTGKTRITIRLDDEVLGWFRAQVHAAGGGNYQSLINLALREYVKKSAEPLEETLRRILREEFRGETVRLDRSGRKMPIKKTMLPKKMASK